MNEHISTGIEADEKDSTGTSLPESLLETQNDLYEEQKNSGQLEMKLMVAIAALRRFVDYDAEDLCEVARIACEALEKIDGSTL